MSIFLPQEMPLLDKLWIFVNMKTYGTPNICRIYPIKFFVIGNWESGSLEAARYL